MSGSKLWFKTVAGEPYFGATVSSSFFCSFPSVFFPRFAAGDEPVCVLRFMPAAEAGEVDGLEPVLEARRAEDLVAGMIAMGWQIQCANTDQLK